jgi:hypothetical protein
MFDGAMKAEKQAPAGYFFVLRFIRLRSSIAFLLPISWGAFYFIYCCSLSGFGVVQSLIYSEL